MRKPTILNEWWALLLTIALLLADATGGQRAHERTHHRQVFLATRQTLAYQVVGRVGQVVLFERDIFTEAVEEG